MDFPPVRRKTNTYGKGVRKILVHDLFEIGSNSSPSPLRPIQTDNTTTLSQPASHFRTSSPQQETLVENANNQDMIDRTEMRQPSPSTTTASSPSSPADTSNLSMFDIQSSDEDVSRNYQGQLNKRRKIAPALSKPKSSLMVTKPAEKRNSKLEHRQSSKSRQAPRLSPARPLPSKQPERESKLSKKATTGLHSTRISSTKSVMKTNKSKMGSDVPLPSKLSRPREVRISSGSSGQLSDASAPSPSPRFSRQSTPKRQRNSSDRETGNTPSPSDLKMTSLRLTPEPIASPLHHMLEDTDMTDSSSIQTAPRKGRRRLIDRLDGPREQNLEQTKRIPELKTDLPKSSSTSHLMNGSVSGDTTVPDRPKLDKPSSNGTNNGLPPRAVRTYARQRSHLSDLVDGLEPNSQHSSQQSFSQVASFTSLASQMELDDDDSDDVGTFRQPKSIHELRRAGAISKFDNELSTLLDEIESQQKSARIRALLQLIQKVTDVTFLRHFQDSSSFFRFTDCANPDLDEISATLIILVFQKMTSAIHSSPKVSAQILDSLYSLPTCMLTTNRSLTKLAKDRRQNLPRLILAEIAEFEETRASESGNVPPTLIAGIFLASLESTLRGLFKHGEHLKALPQSLLGDMISALILNQEAMLDGKGTEEHVENVKLLLSTLEIVSFSHDLVSDLVTISQFSTLVESLAGIMQWAGHDKPQLEQACLRFIVSLSNNQPGVCGAFVEGPLINQVFSVVDDHFSRVAAFAIHGQELDSDRLDAAVLALGCLLNLADCADNAREKMLESAQNGGSMLDGLVDIFNSYFDLTSEAETLDQTPVLVPLGYISMLLCTLCLNTRACERIVQSTKGAGLEHLFSAVETFLIPLRKVEMDLAADGGPASGSFDRFMAVYQAVKDKVA